MKFLGYIMLTLGVIALVAVFIGYTHQWLMAFIGIGMGKALLSESRDNVENGNRAGLR